jgi:hypothetical protein
VRCRQACAERMIALLVASRPTGPADALVTGKDANKLSEAEACRLASRQNRMSVSSWSRRRKPMTPEQLQKWSRQRQRARQTKPGKRGR